MKKSKMDLSEIRLLSVFNSINTRCNDTKNRDYGGRGIKNEWISFDEFYKDMSKGYELGLSIDRKDTNGNYSKSNCRWADSKVQNRNRRSNIVINGKCLSEICEEKGLNYRNVWQRIKIYGWRPEDAINGVRKYYEEDYL